MSTSIYYFSGTGDSLKVSQDIAGKLGDTRIIPMYTAIKSGIEPSEESIGLVFPIHMFGIPKIVSKLINKIDTSSNNKYIFAIVTYGGMLAGSLFQVERKLKASGLKLSYSYPVLMDRKKESYEKWDKNVNDIVDKIKNKSENQIGKATFFNRFIMTGILNNLVILFVNRMDNKFYIDTKCTGCEICQKVCPVENISLKDGKPIWLHHCEQCFACLNWCPEKAIYFGKKGERYRYNNPYILLKDFMPK